MASNGFKGLLFGLILFVAFTWLLLTVAVNFGDEYGKDANEIGGGSLNIESYRDTAEGVEGNASNYRGRFEKGGDVNDVDDISGIFSVATDMVNMLVTPFQLLSQVLQNVLHVPPIIINIFLGLLSISVILGIWKLIKAGY